MRLMAEAIIRNYFKKIRHDEDLHTKDFFLMRDIAINVCKTLLKDEEETKEIFFKTPKGREGNFTPHFMPNNRLLQMETFVNNVVHTEGLPKLKVHYLTVLDRLYRLKKNINDIITVVTNIAIVRENRLMQ